MEHDSFDDSCAREDPRDVDADADADADEERDMRRSSDTHTRRQTHTHSERHTHTEREREKETRFDDERVAKDSSIDKTKTHMQIFTSLGKRKAFEHVSIPQSLRARKARRRGCTEPLERSFLLRLALLRLKKVVLHYCLIERQDRVVRKRLASSQ